MNYQLEKDDFNN
jgi:hypothetical protein